MSETIHQKLISEILEEYIGELRKEQPYIKSSVNSYLQDIIARAQLLLKSGIKQENLQEYFRSEYNVDLILKAFVKDNQYKDNLYKKSYEGLKVCLDESKSYGDLFTEIYEDECHLNEIFVRLVEETEGVAITSAKQLQELTGITEIYGYWDEEKGETVPYGDKKPTKKEAQEIAFKQIEGTFISAMSYRYSKALEELLDTGGKYSDLLQIKPSYFNLPETWSGCLPKDQYSSILWAIENAFLIGEPNTSVRPDLKTIAREIEAPYSVLMDAHKICNIWQPPI